MTTGTTPECERAAAVTSEPTETTPLDAVVAVVGREFAALLARTPAPGLYLVATPIGNLADVTLRALVVMSRADALYCEDTRHSRKLLERYGIRRKLLSLHEHNEEQAIETVLSHLGQGRSAAVLSDAGTPLISDPGYKLVRSVLEAGHLVFAVPGASAVLAALTSSGLPSDCFTFVGFLPAKAGQRRLRLGELASIAGTLVFFEAPGRLASSLATMSEVFGEACPAAVARELTKLHEEMRRGNLGELARWARDTEIRGEVVIALAPVRTPDRQASDDEIAAALAVHAEGTLRDRVAAVAAVLRTPRKRVYDLALRSRKD